MFGLTVTAILLNTCILSLVGVSSGRVGAQPAKQACSYVNISGPTIYLVWPNGSVVIPGIKKLKESLVFTHPVNINKKKNPTCNDNCDSSLFLVFRSLNDSLIFQFMCYLHRI